VVTAYPVRGAEENILLFLDRERRQLVGNSRFSSTLNRVNEQ
jgi:hypothetical protein